MKKIQCDRLLVNDTNVSDKDILECLWPDASKYNIKLVNGYWLWERISEQLYTLSETVDRILLPWASVSILLRCTGIVLPENKALLLPSVKRKLEGLTPRGISISDEDLSLLAQCEPKQDILLLDDVVASGTTANGIAKRIGNPNLKVSALVYREPNELKNTICKNIITPCLVVPETVKFPAINTLSSLQDPNKVNAILSNFRALYDDALSIRIQELFNIS